MLGSGGIIVVETDPQKYPSTTEFVFRGRDRPTRREQMSAWGECWGYVEKKS